MRRPKGKGNYRCICGRTYYEKKNLMRHKKLKCFVQFEEYTVMLD